MQKEDTTTAGGNARLPRRAFLGMVTVLGAGAGVAPPSADSSEPTFELQHWLDTSDPYWVAFYHAQRLAEAMGKSDPSRLYRFEINEDVGFAMVVGDLRNDARGARLCYFVDNGSPLLADDVTGTTAYADWAKGGAA